MENSYVTLELKKYNEMYDKTKKIDELKERFGDEIEDSIIKFCKSIDAMFNSICEDESTKDDNNSDYKVGDKVLIKGVIAEIDPNDKQLTYKIETEYCFYCWVNKNEIYKKEDK